MVSKKVPYYVPLLKFIQKFDKTAALFAVKGQIPIKLMKWISVIYIFWISIICCYGASSSPCLLILSEETLLKEKSFSVIAMKCMLYKQKLPGQSSLNRGSSVKLVGEITSISWTINY